MKELIQIQTELNAPKNRHNNFGKYKYRNLEDIFEAVKPHLAKHGCTLNVTDDLIEMSEQLVIKATATIQKADSVVSSTAFAGIDTNRKGMDIAQSFGASGSYARKYAVSALFLLDDSKDIDTPQSSSKPTAKPKGVNDIGSRIEKEIKAAKTIDDLGNIYRQNEPILTEDLLKLLSERKKEINAK